MRKQVNYPLIFFIIFFCPNILWAQEPVDKGATKSTHQLLEFLTTLPTTHNQIIAGQHLGSNDQHVWYGALSGYQKYYSPYYLNKKLALIGVDYAAGHPNTKGQLKDINDLLVTHWQKGGLVTIMYSGSNPFTGGDAYDQNIHLADLLQEGSLARLAWFKQLDEIATGLKELQDQNVVVLWRPFHELNGNWFWWGYRPTQESRTIVKLWQQMFNYLTIEKGLHNLLWVYSVSPQANDPSIADELTFYPGSEYVDIVALDVYRDQFDSVVQNAVQRLKTTGKPFAISEFGPHPNTAVWGKRNNKSLQFEIESNLFEPIYILAWSDWQKGIFNHRNSWLANPTSKIFLSDPSVLSIEQVRVNR